MAYGVLIWENASASCRLFFYDARFFVDLQEGNDGRVRMWIRQRASAPIYQASPANTTSPPQTTCALGTSPNKQ